MKNLELLHSVHTKHCRGKSLTRVPSTTKQTSADRDKEIEDLRNQIKLMKQNPKKHDTPKQPKHSENKKKYPNSENIQVVSTTEGHTQINVDLLNVLSFIEETIQTLSNYSEQLQAHLDINLMH